jgi:hypothetical protein
MAAEAQAHPPHDPCIRRRARRSLTRSPWPLRSPLSTRDKRSWGIVLALVFWRVARGTRLILGAATFGALFPTLVHCHTEILC